jgi:hypothetical protein
MNKSSVLRCVCVEGSVNGDRVHKLGVNGLQDLNIYLKGVKHSVICLCKTRKKEARKLAMAISIVDAILR